ncbi:hypothetical protein Agub_g11404 [Astrephomene gubernaculifera]|uniref:Membrane-associated protein n=1 Tax=Astrephomene gubernaculifera TaxID=47775 RepID=A0AAD3DWI0_9CHLO|nr:hypothetical protein Agub_g11404 [Astrephomene gubernaculifera]
MVQLTSRRAPGRAILGKQRCLLFLSVAFVLACPGLDVLSPHGVALAARDHDSGTLTEDPYAVAVADSSSSHCSDNGSGCHFIQAFDAPSSASHRQLLATLPSSATNGSASAAFPASAFATWCSSNAACAAAGNLGLSLLYHTNTSEITASTLNWPNVFFGAGVSSLQLISGVVELQLSGFPAKQDQLICSSSSPCVAQLAIPVSSTADVTRSFVCIRLEPSVIGGYYQAYGYPPGSDGTVISGIPVNNVLKCNTTKFGKHIIMQYKQSALVPPSPPVPPPPPPPPPLNTTGAKLTSDTQLKMLISMSLGFDTLKANETLLSSLTSSLESSLTTSLGAMVPALLLLSSETNSTGSIYKISRDTTNTKTVVSVDIRVVVPAGATESQVSALEKLLAENTTAVFSGSPYSSYLLGPASVSVVTSETSTLSDGAVVAITLCTLLALALLIGGIYALVKWRQHEAILPKKPTGDWDAYGSAVVQPRSTAYRRREKEKEKPTTFGEDVASALPPAAVAAGSSGSKPGGKGSNTESGGAGVKSGAELKPH